MSSTSGFAKFLTTPVAQTVIWVTVLVIALCVAAWVVLKFRDLATGNAAPSSDLLSNFREMHQQGELEDTEYRTIKTMLGGKLKDELKDARETGSVRPEQS